MMSFPIHSDAIGTNARTRRRKDDHRDGEPAMGVPDQPHQLRHVSQRVEALAKGRLLARLFRQSPAASTVRPNHDEIHSHIEG
jgi:hypothetical protein